MAPSPQQIPLTPQTSSPFPEKPLNPQLLIFNFPSSTKFTEAL